MKVNKKYFSIVIGGLVIAVIVVTQIKDKNTFDPTAFDKNSTLKLNDASFLDGSLTTKDNDKKNQSNNNSESTETENKTTNDKTTAFNKQQKSQDTPNKLALENAVVKSDINNIKNNTNNNENNIITNISNNLSNKNVDKNNNNKNDNNIVNTDNKQPNLPNELINNEINSAPLPLIKTSSEGAKSNRGSRKSNSSNGSIDDNPNNPPNNNPSDNPSNSGGNSNNGENSGTKGDNNQTPEPDAVPTLPDDMYGDLFEVKKFPTSSNSGNNENSGNNSSNNGSSSGSNNNSGNDKSNEIVPAGGKFIVNTNQFGEDFEYIYYGQALDDWRLLCSMYVYYNIDDTIYRVTEVDKNYFYFGEYPDSADNDFELDIYFRPNTDAEWTKKTVTINVAPYKVVIKSPDGTNLSDKFLFDDKSIDLLPYYAKIQPETDITSLFLGWSENSDLSGEIIRTEYIPSHKGKIILYAMPFVELDSKFKVKMVLDWYDYFPNQLQTLYEYLSNDNNTDNSDDEVIVPDGIQCISMYQTIKKLFIPTSVLDIVFDNWDYYCKSGYEVADDNPNYSAKDGILYNKEQTTIYDIPLSLTDINISDDVTVVNIKPLNNIKKIKFNSIEPPLADISNLDNAEIIVPDEVYYNYLMNWGNELGSNILKTENNAQDNFNFDSSFISSNDKTTIYAVKKSNTGITYIPKETQFLMSNAFESNDYSTEIVVFQEGIKSLGDNAFDNSSVNKVIFNGNIPPEITSNTFNSIENITVYVPLELRQTYIDSWSPIIGQDLSENLISTQTANIYTDNSGSTILSIGDEDIKQDILVKIGDIDNRFDENYQKENNLNITAISNYAFYDCDTLTVIDLPESIKKIGNYAFSNCVNLELAVIGSKDNISIGYKAFSDCDALRVLASNSLNAEFVNNYDLFVFSLYARPNSEGYGYNWNCWDGEYYITDINGNTYLYGEDKDENGIASRFVRGSIVNTDTVDFLENTKEIGPFAFEGLSQVKEIELPETLEYISEYAFDGMGIKELVIPENVNTIGSYAFYGCSELEELYINSKKLKVLDYGVFSDCNKLSKVEFSDDSTITDILTYAFGGSNLTEITLPRTLTNLYYDIFSESNNLNLIRFTSLEPPTLVTPSLNQAFSFFYERSDGFTIEVPSGCEQNYLDTWKYNVFGYTEDDLPENLAIKGENIVRGWLGMDLIDETDLADIEILIDNIENDIETDTENNIEANKETDIETTNNETINNEINITENFTESTTENIKENIEETTAEIISEINSETTSKIISEEVTEETSEEIFEENLKENVEETTKETNHEEITETIETISENIEDTQDIQDNDIKSEEEYTEETEKNITE